MAWLRWGWPVTEQVEKEAPPPPPRASLDEMALAAQDEALRIEGVQLALVENGLRTNPDPQQMAKAQAFRQLANLCDKVALVQDDFISLMRRRGVIG
jgi:hypothetical protein